MSQQEEQLEYGEEDNEELLEARIPPKPKRPLTKFNLFGKLERNYIVQTSLKYSHVPIPAPPETTTTGASESSDASVILVDPYLEIRPEKYRDIVMPPDWFKVGKNKIKRQDYITHGVIKFGQLSKTVVERWNHLDKETKQFLQTIYATELAGYRKEVAAYKEKYGQAIMDAQKATNEKRKGIGHTTTTASSNASNTSANNPVTSHISQINPQAIINSTPRDHLSQTYAMASDQNTAAAQMNQLRNAYFASLQTNAYPSNITVQGISATNNAAAPLVDQRNYSGITQSFDNAHVSGLCSQAQLNLPLLQTAIPHATAWSQNINSSLSSSSYPAAWSQPNQMHRMIGLEKGGGENVAMSKSSAMTLQDATASGASSSSQTRGVQGGAFQTDTSTDLLKLPPNDNAMSSNYYALESQFGQSSLYQLENIDYQSIVMEEYRQQRGEMTPQHEQSVAAAGPLQFTDASQTLKGQDNSIGSASVSTAAQHSQQRSEMTPQHDQSVVAAGPLQFSDTSQNLPSVSISTAAQQPWQPQGQVQPHFWQNYLLKAQQLQNQMTGSNLQAALHSTTRDSSIHVPPETSQLQRQPPVNRSYQAQGADTKRDNETGAKKTRMEETGIGRNARDNILCGAELDKAFDSESS